MTDSGDLSCVTQDHGQLSLDLDITHLRITQAPHQRRSVAIALLADLARALGEQRAELDLERFRRSLTEYPS